MRSQLLGVVMCGGESRRMGTDKGLMLQGGDTWVQLAYAKLSAIYLPIIVSINSSQTESYGQLFKADDLVVDALHIPGPLNGILSVHAAHPDKDILTLACDMTDMDVITLQQLIDNYQSQPGYHYYAYHNGQFFEPLCAIYTSAGLAAIKQVYDHGDLDFFSMQHLLNNGHTKRLAIGNAGAFKNKNSK